MKIALITLTFAIVFVLPSAAQTPKAPAWTETDRKFLLDNLIRTKEEILKETNGLSAKQWNFKESPDRWSINQVVEHIAIWELIFMNDVSQALARPSDSTHAYFLSDSIFVNNAKSPKKFNALDYTKPFSYAVPLGINEGKNNLTWLMTMRNESIEYLKTETRNIRWQYDYCSGANVHQAYIMFFSHTDRHLKQIRKVKEHKDYPKK